MPEEKTEKPQLDLVIYPNPFLRFKTVPFTQEQLNTPLVKTRIKDIADAMIEKMYEFHGVGLAANQVGVPNSIFVTDHQWHKTGIKKPKVFLNPQLIFADESKGIEIPRPGEGCLSLPYGFRRPIPRPAKIQVSWLDLEGIAQTNWFDQYEAIVIQHELDHLNGHVFVDHLSRIQQDMFKRRVKKIRRQYQKGYKKALHEIKNAPRTKEYAWKRAKESKP